MPSRRNAHNNEETRYLREAREARETRYTSHEEEEVSSGENIVLQCIISGVLLVAVLAISLIDAGPMATLREAVQQTLTGAHTVDELVIDVRNLGEDLLGWGAMVDAPANAGGQLPTIAELDTNEVPPMPATPPPDTPSYEFIEQTPIVAEYYVPLTAAYEALNPQIPGPSVVPGLWE